MIIGNRDVTNPLEVIECIVAFDCKDYSARPRDRMLYAIVFGWDDEEYTRFGWDNETINEYKELHKRFEELSRIDDQPQVGGWIPVSERLPEEEGRYLCAYGKNLMCVYSFSNDLFSVDDYDFAKYKFEKKKGFYAYDSEWGYWEVDFIKAWQPLPEPFKEEKDV